MNQHQMLQFNNLNKPTNQMFNAYNNNIIPNNLGNMMNNQQLNQLSNLSVNNINPGNIGSLQNILLNLQQREQPNQHTFFNPNNNQANNFILGNNAQKVLNNNIPNLMNLTNQMQYSNSNNNLNLFCLLWLRNL